MDGDRIILQGLGAVGWIEARFRGPIYLRGERGGIEICYDADRGKWYAHIAFSKVSENMVRGEWRQVPRQPKGNLTAGIDIGINNLLAIYVKCGLTKLINGRPLKSISYYWRKRISEYQSTLNKYGLKTSKRLKRMYSKWRGQIRHYIDAKVRGLWSGFIMSGSPRLKSVIQRALRRRTATSITIMSGHMILAEEVLRGCQGIRDQRNLRGPSYTLSRCPWHGDGCGIRISRGIIQVYDDEQGIQRRPCSGIQHSIDISNPEPREGWG